MADEKRLAAELAKLDDAALLTAVNEALAARQGTPTLTEQERDDERFYRSLYPTDDTLGPRVIRKNDED